jgi:hypothetical protein
MLVALVLGYVLLAVHAYWVQTECTTAYASGTVLDWPCTPAIYTLPLTYFLPPAVAAALSRLITVGVATAIATVELGMDLPNLRLAGLHWYAQMSSYYLAVVPALFGAVVGAFIARRRRNHVA